MEHIVTEKNYISWVVVCTHPLVERCWQFGGDFRVYESDPPNFRTVTCLLMKDGERKDFPDVKENFDAANEYLKSIQPLETINKE